MRFVSSVTASKQVRRIRRIRSCGAVLLDREVRHAIVSNCLRIAVSGHFGMPADHNAEGCPSPDPGVQSGAIYPQRIQGSPWPNLHGDKPPLRDGILILQIHRRNCVHRTPEQSLQQAEIGIIGGSGLYSMPGLTNTREQSVTTPFGDPSDAFVLGDLEGRKSPSWHGMAADTAFFPLN